MGGLLLSPSSKDRVTALAAIRVRALALVDIKLSAGPVVVARRRSTAVDTAPLTDRSRAVAPLGPLPNV